MINYNNLRKKFTNKLKEFNKEKLVKWIEFDNNRDVLNKLLSGERVGIKIVTTRIYKLTDSRENIESTVDDFSSATAA